VSTFRSEDAVCAREELNPRVLPGAPHVSEGEALEGGRWMGECMAGGSKVRLECRGPVLRALAGTESPPGPPPGLLEVLPVGTRFCLEIITKLSFGAVMENKHSENSEVN
jgi:hypothetical protein